MVEFTDDPIALQTWISKFVFLFIDVLSDYASSAI